IKVNQDGEFYSDESKIRVILNNLIGNAVKFQKDSTDPRKIELSIHVHGGVTNLRVSDNGIGIEEKHQTDIFKLFHRATQKNVGSGLGLYMVKESVDQMEGKIELKSKVNEGTVVEVLLPDLKERID